MLYLSYWEEIIKELDCEDAVQYTVAESNGVDCIITRNKDDFEENEIPCYSSQEFLEKYSDGLCD